MEMHYRGAVYESSPSYVETTERDIIGHYRGAVVRFRRPTALPYQPKLHLKYRGAWVNQ